MNAEADGIQGDAVRRSDAAEFDLCLAVDSLLFQVDAQFESNIANVDRPVAGSTQQFSTAVVQPAVVSACLAAASHPPKGWATQAKIVATIHNHPKI